MQEHLTFFINGVAGIGKSEFAKYYANKNHKKTVVLSALSLSASGMEAEELLYEMM